MAVLLSGAKLQERLAELARKSHRIDIAVAWATPSEALAELLRVAQKASASAVRILVGVSGFVTHPEALRSIRSFASLRVHVEPGVLFHPKLYIFHLEKTSVCWVGSPNLTRRAFEENIELSAEVDDSNGQILRHFEEMWNSKESTSEFDVEGYEKAWFEATKRLPLFLKREASVESTSISKPEILTGKWKEFANDLSKTGDLDAAKETIRRGHEIVARDWSKDLDKVEQQIIFGLKSGPFSHFGFLDRVLAVHKQDFVGGSDRAIQNRLKIGQALRAVIDAKTCDVKLVEQAFIGLRKGVHGCGPALASRLLLFTRPDWFVVVNKKSRDWLGGSFGLKIPKDPNGRQYAALIESMHRTDWWHSARPDDPEERELWDYRAALTDRLAFEDFEATHGHG